MQGGGSSPGKENKRLVSQCSQAVPSVVGNRPGGSQNQSLMKERPTVELSMENGQTDDSNVNISFHQSGNLCRSRHVAHFKFDLRVSFAKAQNGSGQELGNGSDSESNPQRAGTAHGSIFCEAQRGLGILKDLFRPRQQHPARFRNFNFPASSGEQSSADFLFQLSDL